MELPKRKDPRLKEYDYSQNGAYFVTICLNPRLSRFGTVRRGDPCGRPPVPPFVELTDLGNIAEANFAYLETQYPVSIPAYIVMPDHIHAIFLLEQRATARVAPTLGQIVGAYKSKVFHQCLSLYKSRNLILGSLWQRGYYEHILRNQDDFDAAAEYIHTNPTRRLGKISQNSL